MMKTIFTTLLWVCALLTHAYATNDPCKEAHKMSCGDSHVGHTHSGDSYFSNDSYGGHANGDSYSGTDKMYRISKQSDGPLYVHMSTESPNLNIFLANECWDGVINCIAGGRTMSKGKYISESNLPKGEYWVIVDSKNKGDGGDYTISMSCEKLTCSSAKKNRMRQNLLRRKQCQWSG